MLTEKIDSAKKILLDASNIDTINNNRTILYSGGKDSIVMAHLVKETLGIKRSFCEISLMSPSDVSDIKRIGDALGLDVHYNCQINPKDMATLWNDYGAVPRTSMPSHRFDALRHWISIPNYVKSVGSSMMIFGRRNQENKIPKPIYYKKGTPALQVMPIWNWTTEEIWKYLKMNNLEYPSCYNGVENDPKKARMYIVLMKAQLIYIDTNDITKAYDYWHSHLPEYLEEVRKVDLNVDRYLALK